MSHLRHSSPSSTCFVDRAVHRTPVARSPAKPEDQLLVGSMWEDDPELLRATLSLLLPDTQGVEDDGSSSSGDVAEATRKRRSVNKSRERQKEELQVLRGLAKELEANLAAIKRGQQKQVQRARPATDGEFDSTRLWKATALRQFHARKRAELVNRKLRLAVQEHEHISRELLQALQAVANTRQLLSQWSFGAFHDSHPSILTENELLNRIARVCGQCHAPFSVFKNVNRDNFIDVCVIRDSEDEVVLELHWRSSHPFTVRQLSSALWSFWGDAKVLEDDYSVVADAREKNDHMFTSIEITTSKEDVSGSVAGTGVRRTVHAAVDEFLQVATAQCMSRERPRASAFHSSSTSDDQVLMARDQYLRIIPAHSKKDVDRSILSVVEQVIRARMQFPAGRPERSRVEFFMRLLRTFMKEELRCALEVAERELIRSPMKRARVTPIDSNTLGWQSGAAIV